MRVFLCSLFFLSTTGFVASAQHGATASEKRLAVKMASEEPGYTARKYMPNIDYPAVVRRCLARHRSSFRSLFALSAHTDAVASDLQAAILAIVLKQVGDDFFFSRLERVPEASRLATIELLSYGLLNDSPPPFRILLDDYPKIMRLLVRSNQALERTDSADRTTFVLRLYIPPRRSLSLGRWYGC